MASDFEVGDGEIRVRDRDGSFRPVPTPVGFSDLAFRNAVSATYTCYLRDGKLPSVTEVHKLWPNIPVKTYSAIFLTEEFKQALDYRGVAWDPEQGLSLEQQLAIVKMSDPSDRRSQNVKLKELNIPVARWQAWQKHPLFREAWTKRAEDTLAEAVNGTIVALAGNAMSGDLQASKLVLEMTGRWNPSQQSLDDARMVVQTLVEVMVEEIADPELRSRILGRVQGVVAGYTLNNSRVLER